MATLTPQQVRETSAYWADKWFVRGNLTAVYTIDDINAAVSAIDGTLDNTLNALVTAGNGTRTVAQTLNAALPAPFSGATLQQKAELLSFAVMKRYGLL